MFTGFDTENIPAIKVWDFSWQTSSTIRTGLTDDCAPIQFFKTGGSSTTILVYLPSNPVEGKIIKIINSKYGSNNTKIGIFVPDRSAYGGVDSTTAICELGPGQTLDFCYSKNFITFGTTAGLAQTGWISLNQSPVSSAIYNSVVLGGTSNSATSTNAAALGGFSNTASSAQAVAVGGNGNSAGGFNAVLLGGNGNTTSGTSSGIVGGSGNQARAAYAVTIGGENNNSNSSAYAGGIFSGGFNLADSVYATVIGGSYGTTRSIWGNCITPASASPVASSAGVQQTAVLLVGVQTIDATSTILRSNTSAAGTTNQLIMPNNSAYYVRGSVIANVTGGGNTSSWTFQGVIKRGANAASTTLVAAITPTLVAQDAGASAWVVTVTADTTNGGLAVTVTGAAATTIRWVCKLESTEVTF